MYSTRLSEDLPCNFSEFLFWAVSMKVSRGRATTEVMEHGKLLRCGMFADGFRLSWSVAKATIAAAGLLPLFACARRGNVHFATPQRSLEHLRRMTMT